MKLQLLFLLLLIPSSQQINPFLHCFERNLNNYCDLECEDEFLPQGDCSLYKPPTIIHDVNLTVNQLPFVFQSRQRYTVLQWRIQHKARITILTDVSKIKIPANAFDDGRTPADFIFWIIVRFETRASEDSSPVQIKEALESSLEEKKKLTEGEAYKDIIFVCMLAVLAILLAYLVLIRTRRRRSVFAPVWIPPMEDDLKKVPDIFKTNSSIMYGRINESEYASQTILQRTALHDIVEDNDPMFSIGEKLEKIDQLVFNGIDINAQSELEETALFTAVRHQNHQLVLELLSLGADPTIMNRNNSTCLHQAVHNIDIKMLELLLKCPNVINTIVDGRRSIDAVDDTDRTPLMLCADYPLSAKMVRMLLEAGADPSDPGDKESVSYTGMTALHHAARTGNLNMIKILLNIRSVKINAYDQQGATAIWYAVNGGHASCVEALLNGGADMYSPDHLERFPLDVARSKGFTDIEEILFKYQIERKEKLKQPPAKVQNFLKSIYISIDVGCA